MSKESFRITFSTLNMNDIEKEKYEKALKAPDNEYAKKGLEEREEF